jgi:hypothetical protein
MSLNWQMPKEFHENHKNLMYTDIKEDGSCKVQVDLECLIFSTMTIQHNLTGEMTDKKLFEIQRRLDLLKGQEMLMSWTVWHNEERISQSVDLETVIRYWGLDTNVIHLNERKWNSYFLRITKPREYDFKYVLDDAKEKAKDTSITQSSRTLALLKAKAEKATAELTTPPPVS